MIREGQRKVRSDKGTRVNPNLKPDVHRKLQKLALACGVSKTVFAAEILQIALDTPEFVRSIQEFHNTPDDDRIIPIVSDGKVYF